MDAKIIKDNNMIKNEIMLLDQMMNDLKKAPEIYRPGNYWEYYRPKIYKYISKINLNNLRGDIIGPGTTASFGGGADIGTYYEQSSLYPFSDLYSFIDDSRLVKTYNRLINLLSSFNPYFGLLGYRIGIAKKYFYDWVETARRTAYNYAELLDTENELEKIEDSKSGNPDLFFVKDRGYTLYFLAKFIEYLYMKKYVDFSKIKYIIELGSGFGMQAYILLKLYPHLKYCIMDIPPALYAGQQYLESIFPNEVLKYNDINKNLINERSFDDYRIVCLGAWQIENIDKNLFDLFINSESFQEMEPHIVQNYLEKIIAINVKNIYLKNLEYGHHKAKAGKHGVLEQTTKDHYKNILSSNGYDLINEGKAITYWGETAYWQSLHKVLP